jgi:hypothetical protein
MEYNGGKNMIHNWGTGEKITSINESFEEGHYVILMQMQRLCNGRITERDNTGKVHQQSGDSIILLQTNLSYSFKVNK